MSISPTLLLVQGAQINPSPLCDHLEYPHLASYHILKAATKSAALSLCQDRLPDLILLDDALPHLSGLAVLQELGQLWPDTPLPVLMITDQTDPAVSIRALELGAQDCLIKESLTAESLHRAIELSLTKVRLADRRQQRQRQQQRLSALTLQMCQSFDLQTILRGAVSEIREMLATDRVVIYQFAPDLSGEIVAEAVIPPWASLHDPIKPVTNLLQTLGETTAIAPPRPPASAHRQLLKSLPVQAKQVVPILINFRSNCSAPQNPPRLWGLLIVHHYHAPRRWQDDEQSLLDELAMQLGVAIQQAELYSHLQQLNANLESHVEQRTAELKASENRFRAIFNNTFQLTSLLTLEGRLLEVNQTTLDFGGVSREEVVGLPLWETPWWTLTADAQAKLRGAITQASQGEFVRYEAQIQGQTGAIATIDFSLRPLRDEAGCIVMLISEGRDVSEKARLEAERQQVEVERQKAEAALRRSEAQTRAMLQALPDLIMRMTVDGRYLDFFSSGAVKVLPLPNPAVADNTVFDVFDSSAAQRRLQYLERAVTTQELQMYEQTIFVEGEEYCEEVRVVPCGEDEALVVVRDTTERQKAEAALRRSEAKNRAMLQALPDLVMRMTADGQYLDFFSGGRVRALPLPHPVLTENRAADGLPRNIAQQRLHYLKQALETRETQVYEQELCFEDEARCEEVRIVPCGEDEALVVVRDITERKEVERALQVSEERLRLVFDATQDGIWDWDINRNLGYSSPRIYEMLGRPSRLVQVDARREFLRFTHPADRDRMSRALRTHFDYHIPYNLEVRLQRADGTYGWFWTRGEALRDDSGKPYRMTGAISDITERKQMEAALYSLNQELEQRVADRTQELAEINRQLRLEIEQRQQIEVDLRESRQFIESIADSSPNILYIYDIPDNRNVYLNRSVQELMGYSAAEIIEMGSRFMSLCMHPEDLPKLLAYPYQVSRLDDGAVSEIEYRVRRADGEYRWFNSRDTVFKRNQAGHAIQYVGTAQDITQRKLAEAALRESEATKRALINAIPDLLLRINRTGDCLDVFTSGGVRLVHPERVISGVNIGDILPSEVVQGRLECIRQALDTGLLQTHEYQLQIDDSLAYEEARIVPCGYEDSVLVMVRNITARKQAENTVRRNQARFQRLSANSPGALYQFVLYPNGQRKFPYMSDRIYDITELDPAAIRKDAAVAFNRIHPEDVPSLEQSILASATALTPWTWEFRLITPSNRLIWLQGMSQPEQQEDGSILWDGVFLDITQRKQAEQELEANRRFIERVTESTPSVLYIFDLEQFKTVYVNRNFHETLGWSGDQPNQQSILIKDLMHPEDWPRFLEHLQKVEATEDGKVLTFEYRMKSCNQDWWWFESFDTPFSRSADGKVIQVIGSALNVSDRKQAEAALQDSKDQFLELAENIDDVFWMISGDMQETFYVSPAFEKIWGIPVSETHTNPRVWLQAIHPDDQQRVDHALAALPETGDYHEEYRVLRPDNEMRWVRDRAFPIRDDRGEIYRIAGIAEDITDRKQAETKLLRYRDLRDAIFNNSTDALFLVDAETVLTLDCNNRAVELFEADSKAALIGIPAGDVLQKTPFTAQELQAINVEIAAQGFWSREVEYCTFKGKELWGNLAARPILVGEQTINLVRVTDITDRKRGEEEIRRTLQREKELNDLKSRFISMTSHEFRTPLAVIASSAGILKTFGDRLTPEKQQEHLKTIQTYVRHTTELLDDILLLNRAEAGKLAFAPTALNLVEFCETLTQELQLSTTQHTLTFTSSVTAQSAKAEPYEVQMDKKLLRQIITNLLANAIKYSPEGGQIHFKLWLNPESVHFEIQDWGLGIPEADLTHLFESFHRANNVGAIQGTGLGLSVVQKCVNVHQGTVTIQSQVGEGTTVAVVLPRYC